MALCKIPYLKLTYLRPHLNCRMVVKKVRLSHGQAIENCGKIMDLIICNPKVHYYFSPSFHGQLPGAESECPGVDSRNKGLRAGAPAFSPRACRVPPVTIAVEAP